MFIDEMNKKTEEWDLMIDAISLKKYKNLVEIENDILTALNCIYDDDWFKEQYCLIDEDLSFDDRSVEDMCIQIIDKYVYGGSTKRSEFPLEHSFNLEDFKKNDAYLNEHNLLDASGEPLDASRENIISNNIFVFIQKIIREFVNKKIGGYEVN